MVRTTVSRVTFGRPFSLSNVDGVQPPGTYTIEVEDEQLEGLSFIAYRRIRTTFLLPGKPGAKILTEAVPIEPAELALLLQASNVSVEDAGQQTP